MRETPTSNNVDDFRQRYHRSFGFLIGDDGAKKTLIQITNVSFPNVMFDTLTGKGYYAKIDADVWFEFLPITRGWYRTREHGAVLFQRVPARQFSRGISKGNTNVFYLPVGRAGFYGLELSLGILHDVFVQKVPEKLGGNNYIINKFFYIHGPDVFFYANKIGTFVDNTIKLSHPLVEQEMRDAIARNNLPFNVTTEE